MMEMRLLRFACEKKHEVFYAMCELSDGNPPIIRAMAGCPLESIGACGEEECALHGGNAMFFQRAEEDQ